MINLLQLLFSAVFVICISASALHAQITPILEGPGQEEGQIKLSPIDSISPEQLEALIPSRYAKMTFDNEEYDWGVITQGEKAFHTFRFTNTSDEPLILTNARGTCGCTVPVWPKEPVMPGESAEIHVVFNSKGKQGLQRKSIILTGNTFPADTRLTIKGEIIVEKEADAEIEVQNLKNPKKVDVKGLDCLSIYPNPTSEFIKVNVEKFIGKSAIVVIYNEAGHLMERKKIKEIEDAELKVNVSDFPSGMYIAAMQIEDNSPISKCFFVSTK